jgi:biopolymer transport protein ExbD
MIKMPHRNVTRFFIPLIDVLILLFCIFLLMDFNAESKADIQLETVEDQSADILRLEENQRRITAENQKFDEMRPQLEKTAELLKRIAELEKANQKNLQERSFFRIIDIDSKDGTISFYDESRPDQPVIKLADEKAVQVLIERHKQEAKGREVYYYFMPPRPLEGFPTKGQIRNYKAWFSKAANSLAEK